METAPSGWLRRCDRFVSYYYLTATQTSLCGRERKVARGVEQLSRNDRDLLHLKRDKKTAPLHGSDAALGWGERTAAQTSLYWREWQEARRAGRLSDGDRERLHLEALGYEASSKKLTNAEFDKVLGAFRAISRPYSINAQVRQQEQPNTRRLHRISNLLKCLGLFVAEPVQYATAILRDRFHVAVLEDLARVDLHAELIADRADLKTQESELEKLIFTLSRCLSTLRRKGDFISRRAHRRSV